MVAAFQNVTESFDPGSPAAGHAFHAHHLDLLARQPNLGGADPREQGFCHQRSGLALFVAQQINLSYFTPFEPFTAVGAILIVLVAVFSLLVTGVERALRLP